MFQEGFTLIELMIVVAIVGILASVTIPTFKDSVRKSKEAMCKGNLGTIRSALAVYYSDTEGRLPTDDLTSLTTGGKYLTQVPVKSTPYFHPDGNSVSNGSVDALGDSRGDWFYVSAEGDPLFGKVLVNCTHIDLRGNVWSEE